MTYKIAQYTPSKNSDYAGNPFIETLPSRLSAEAFWENVQEEAVVPEDLDELDIETIEDKAANIMSSVCPTSIYYDVYCDLLRTIKVGYKERNPVSEDTKRWQQSVATSMHKRKRTVAPSLKFSKRPVNHI